MSVSRFHHFCSNLPGFILFIILLIKDNFQINNSGPVCNFSVSIFFLMKYMEKNPASTNTQLMRVKNNFKQDIDVCKSDVVIC